MKAIVKVVAGLVFLLTACTKKHGNPPGLAGYRNAPEAGSGQMELNRELGWALEEVYRHEGAWKEVVALIGTGYYVDERVLLRDLLDPSSGAVYGALAAGHVQVDTGVFRKHFCEIVMGGRFPRLRALLTMPQPRRPLPRTATAMAVRLRTPAEPLPIPEPEWSMTDGEWLEEAAIYFPYSENFSLQPATGAPRTRVPLTTGPTIVVPEGETDLGIGRAPYACGSAAGGICYREVQVDDDYAESSPTHIITQGAVVAPFPLTPSVTNTTVTRVYHGWVRLTKQMDHLISLTGNGGGSEIRAARINNYLDISEGQITRFSGDVLMIYFTRADIRKKRWKRLYAVWDPNWSYQDLEQVYAVYEDDTRGNKTISGSLNSTASLGGKTTGAKGDGQVGFRIDVQTQDEILVQRKIDRKSFLKDGLNNQGWGFFEDPDDFLPEGMDWPIYDGGSIWQYTLPFRIN